ncbi:MAG: hypothetical protein U1G07_02970 [Verrucomicrobiota bacterium]
MRRIPSDRLPHLAVDRLQSTARSTSPLDDGDFTDWLTPARPAGTLDVQRLAEQAEHVLADLGIQPDVGPQFLQHVPPRLAKIRAQVCQLARVQGAARQQVSLAGLSMQCQWLASYARMANFYAVSQVASTLEGLTKGLYDAPGRLNEATLRSVAQGVDLISALATTSPNKTGRAEGARVLVADDEASSRLQTLSVLEQHGVAGIGMGTIDGTLSLLNENTVDVIVLQAAANATTTAQLCQAIRRLPRQGLTPLLVLSAAHQWESRAVLAMSGASEVVPRNLLEPELALKVLGYFFRARLEALS